MDAIKIHEKNINIMQKNKINLEKSNYNTNKKIESEIIWLIDIDTKQNIPFKCSEFELPLKPNKVSNIPIHLQQMRKMYH